MAKVTIYERELDEKNLDHATYFQLRRQGLIPSKECNAKHGRLKADLQEPTTKGCLQSKNPIPYYGGLRILQQTEVMDKNWIH